MNQQKNLQHHVLLCYKNFSKDCNVSHIGLGVTASYTAKTLIQNGMYARALPIFGTDDPTFLKLLDSESDPVTHVMIMAQFIATKHLALLVRKYPKIIFTLKCHSNVGFLQAEPPAITLLRDAIDLQMGNPNFHAACNNMRLQIALQNMYGHPVTYLPNLYYLHGHEPIHRPLWNGGLLRIGVFGSLRVYKNFSTAVAAAVELTQQLKCHSEIWINSGRNDGAGNVVFRAAQSWVKGVPNVTLKELPWASWPEFRKQIGSMNVLFQPSYTETFNNVTADGIAEGVPSVVSDTIEWAPHYWIANADNSSEVASTARRLLTDPYAAADGYKHLRRYVKNGVHIWQQFLDQ